MNSYSAPVRTRSQWMKTNLFQRQVSTQFHDYPSIWNTQYRLIPQEIQAWTSQDSLIVGKAPSLVLLGQWNEPDVCHRDSLWPDGKGADDAPACCHPFQSVVWWFLDWITRKTLSPLPPPALLVPAQLRWSLAAKRWFRPLYPTESRWFIPNTKAHNDIGEKWSVGTYFRTQKACHALGEASFNK